MSPINTIAFQGSLSFSNQRPLHKPEQLRRSPGITLKKLQTKSSKLNLLGTPFQTQRNVSFTIRCVAAPPGASKDKPDKPKKNYDGTPAVILAKRLRKLHNSNGVEKVLEKEGVEVNKESLKWILLNLGDLRASHRALPVFRWAQDRQGMQMDTNLYSALLHTIAPIAPLNQMEDLVSEMQEAGCELDFRCHAARVQCMCRNNLWRQAKELVSSGELPALPGSCIAELVKCCAKADGIDAAYLLLDQLAEHNPDVLSSESVTLALLDVCQRTSQPLKAPEVLTELEKRGIVTSQKGYERAMNAAAAAGDPSLVRGLIQDLNMQQMPLTRLAYTALIRAHLIAGEREEAMHTLDLMTSQGGVAAPRGVTFAVMARECASVKDKAGFKQTMERMKPFKEDLDKSCYTMLINACTDLGKWVQAEEMLVEMKRAGLKPDVVTYTQLMTAYLEDMNMEGGQQVWQEMVDRGIRPNVIAFSEYIEGFAKGGQVDIALERMVEMRQTRRDPSMRTCLTLIKALAVEARWIDAYDQLMQLKNSSINIDESILQELTQGVEDKDMKAILSCENKTFSPDRY